MAKVEHAQRDDDDGRVVASSGGVQVRKWVAVDAAAVPVVKFEMASARDEPVQVTVNDEVPEHLDPEDVGFHDDFHGDRWRRPAPREIRFETVLGPGEEVTTVYGVRQDDVDDESAFQNRPEVTVSAGASSGEAGADASASDDVVDERLERALDEAAAASDDGDETGEGTETLSLEDPTGESSTADESSTAAGDASGSDEVDVAVTDDVGESTGTAQTGASESTFSDAGAVWNGESAETLRSTDEVADSTGPVAGSTTAGDTDSDATAGTAADADATTSSDASDSSESGDAMGTESGSADAGGSIADDSSGRDSGGSGASVAEGTVVDRLAAELQSGGVDDGTREALARELNLQLSASSSQFVEHLQSRMKEKRGQLETDIERLEDSIAELYGLKADSSMMSSLRDEKADEAALAEVSAAVDALEDAKADLGDVQALQDALEDVEAVAATEAELESTASDLEDRVAALDASIADVDERTAS